MTDRVSIGSKVRKTRVMSLLFSAFALATLLAAPQTAAAPLKDLLESRDDLSVFTQALKHSPLWGHLQSHGPLTLFVPSNAGMQEEGSSFLLEEVLTTSGNTARLWDRLALHMVPGASLSSASIRPQLHLNTLADLCISLQEVGDGLQVGPDAMVTEHISADDGSLFVIDGLLWRQWNGEDHCEGPALGRVAE